MHPLQIAQIEREIEDLLASYPELAEDETLRSDMIEGETEAAAVLTRIIEKMREAETMANAIGQRLDDLDGRRKSFERRAEAMKTLALRIMNAAQLRKMPLLEATLSIRAVPPSVVITDPAAIPVQFMKTRMEPSKSTIKEALERGEEVPGASLSNGRETLSVRTK